MTPSNQPIKSTDNKSIPVKKKWMKPDFEILDSYDINAKNNPFVKEHTGHLTGTPNGSFATFGSGVFAPHKNTCIS